MIKSKKKLTAFMLSLALVSMGFLNPISETITLENQSITVSADETTTIENLPSEYKKSMDWI